MESKFSAFLKYSCLALMSIVFFQSQAAVYYSQKSFGGSNNPTLLTSWKSSPTGGGTSPSNFSSGDEFHIINGDNMIATALWTVSGGGKLVIDNGKFSANGFDHTLTADINNTSEYAVKSAYSNLTLGSVSTTSTFTVEYVQGGSTTHLRYITYGGNLNINITSTSGIIVTITNALTTGGNLIFNASKTSHAFKINTSGTFTVAGDFIFNNGTFSAAEIGVSPIFNIAGNFILNNGILTNTKTTGSPTFNIDKNFSMTNGTFYGIVGSAAGNATYNINGNFTTSGGTYIGKYASPSGNLKINLNGPANTISMTNTTLTSDNHQITVNGNYSLLSNLSLSNLLTISSGKSLSIGANTLTLKSGYSGIGSLIGGATSNIVIAGTTAQAISLKSIPLSTFTINNSAATVTLAGQMLVANTLNLTLGTINNSSNSLTLSSNASIVRNTAKVTASPIYAGVVNVTYNGGSSTTTDLEIPYNNATVINNLTFSNTAGAVAKLLNNITVTGTLTINSNATFDTNGKTLTLLGNVVNNGSFVNANNTVVFAGTTALSGSSSYTFNNITLNASSSLTAAAGGTITVGNIFAASSNSTFTANGGTVAFARASGTQVVPGKVKFYNVTLSNGSAKSFSQTDTVYIAKDLNVSGGSLNMAKSNLSFNGGTQTIPSLAYNNLILAGTGTKTPAASPLTISNNLSIQGSATLNGTGLNITIPGYWVSYGPNSYSASNGTVTFTGTTGTTINANGTVFNNVTFAATGAKVFTSAATVSGILTLTSGIVNTGGLLTVNLTSGSISGAGSGTLNGNVTFVKNVPHTAANFLSFPVAGATGADLADDFEFTNPSTNKTRLSIWDCATQKYLSSQAEATAFTQGIGFQFYIPASGNIDVTGAYNHVSGSYTVNGCTSAANKFILAGNPYPSAMDWANAGWTKTGLNDAIYFFNPTTSTFASYINGTPSNGGSSVIPSFQGFYVTTSGSGSPSLTMTNATRTIVSNPSLYRTATTDLFSLRVAYKQYIDEAVVVLDKDASYEFEGDRDAIKLLNPNSAPSLYTKSLGTDYSINSIPGAAADYVLPLGLSVTESGTYTFTSSNSTDKDVYLEDKLTGKSTNLKETPTYTVVVDSTNTNRFQLRFSATNSNTSSTTTGTSVYYYEGAINMVFGNTGSNGTVSLYSVVGSTVLDNIPVNTSSGSAQVNTTSIKPGAYVVKVIQDGQVTTKTIVIQ